MPTDNLDLPYPTTDDAPNGPAAIQALADAVDALLGSLINGATGTITASSPYTVSNTLLIKLGRLIICSGFTARASGSASSFTTFGTIPAAYRPAADGPLMTSTPLTTSGVITKGQVLASTGELQISMSGANSGSMYFLGVWQAAS
jgi:hypothetical protein